VALSQYSDSDAGIIAVYAAGLVACAGGGVFIAFELERRRRFVYKVRLVALDLVAAVEFDNRTMLARRLGTAFTKLEPELRSRAAFEVIACIESQLLEAGAYRAATEIGDARRRVRACGKLADREVAG
jgi:hypothetical protein